jgi:flagellar hook-associated protein 1 FlgK
MGSGIFNLGTRAMGASQAMLDSTAHNISNVNTPGYSRQHVELSTESGMYTGAGFLGRGVRVTTITRDTNEFLVKDANLNAAHASADKTRMDKLDQLEKTLPTGEAGLGYAASQVLNAFVDVTNQPQDMAARQVVLSRAQEFATRTNTAAKQIDNLQTGVVSDMKVSVAKVNKLTAEIAKVNQDIAKYNGVGHDPNDLMDKRDKLIKDLNKEVQVSTVNADDGSVSVFMGGGQLLVLSNNAQTLLAVPDPSDTTKIRVALQTDVNDTTNASARILDNNQLTGGAIKGLMQVQDEDITSTRDQLNTFTQQFADALNHQQSLGLDLNGNTATTPIFSDTDNAVTIKLALSKPAGIAAASPLMATMIDTNTGTADIKSLSMVQSSLPSGVQPPLTIAFVNDATAASGMSYQIKQGSTTLSTHAWVPGEPVSDGTPTFKLEMSGVPASGDSILVEATSHPANNNGNALAILNLRDQTLVSLDGTSQATLTDGYSQMIGNLGVIVQAGKTASGISSTVATTADQVLAATAGVNLDEEASHLIQYQQSYQASAKVLQVAQTVFDTLLNIQR